MRFVKSGLAPGGVFSQIDQNRVEVDTESFNVSGEIVASGNITTTADIVQGSSTTTVVEMVGQNVELFRFDIRHVMAAKLVISGHYEHKSLATELLISCNIADVASVEYGTISPSDEQVFNVQVSRVGDYIRVTADSLYDVEYTAHATVL